jgi:hypothetical protein
MSDPVKAITNRLKRSCKPFADLSLERASTSDWRSLLFDGARHHIEVDLSGSGIDAALTALQETAASPDFAIGGHLIADIQTTVTARNGKTASVVVDVLTIEN